MRLAILVVYVFDDARIPLFDHHLDRLRRHTGVPFRIFAAAHKVRGAARARIAAAPEIEVVDCAPPKDAGVRDEHSHCLDRLAAHADGEGFTHSASLHLDSFPIRDGWAQAMLAGADGVEADLASIVPNGYSAGLVWSRSFYTAHRPAMLVPQEERATETFRAFVAAHPDFDRVETGLGYLYAAWKAGAPWRAVPTDAARKIYGGVLFHLVAGTWRTWSETLPIRSDPATQALWRAVRPTQRRLPRPLRGQVREWFADTDRVFRDGSVSQKRAELDALVADPDGFVDACLQSYRGPVQSLAASR